MNALTEWHRELKQNQRTPTVPLDDLWRAACHDISGNRREAERLLKSYHDQESSPRYDSDGFEYQ